MSWAIELGCTTVARSLSKTCSYKTETMTIRGRLEGKIRVRQMLCGGKRRLSDGAENWLRQESLPVHAVLDSWLTYG